MQQYYPTFTATPTVLQPGLSVTDSFSKAQFHSALAAVDTFRRFP